MEGHLVCERNFINASYVDVSYWTVNFPIPHTNYFMQGYKLKKRFIATQGYDTLPTKKCYLLNYKYRPNA